jgi:hypothetical protein
VGKRQRGNPSRPRGTEHGHGGTERFSGGDHVINNNDRHTWQNGAFSERKGMSNIPRALFFWKHGLLRGHTSAHKERLDARAVGAGGKQCLRKPFSLVKTTLTFAT